MSIDYSNPGTPNEINQTTQAYMINDERFAAKTYLLRVYFVLSVSVNPLTCNLSVGREGSASSPHGQKVWQNGWRFIVSTKVLTPGGEDMCCLHVFELLCISFTTEGSARVKP